MADTLKPDRPLELQPLQDAPERSARERPFQLPPDDPSVSGRPYQGPERRKGGERRQGQERREEIRFEPGKADRRSGKDRRKRSRLDDTLIR